MINLFRRFRRFECSTDIFGEKIKGKWQDIPLGVIYDIAMRKYPNQAVAMVMEHSGEIKFAPAEIKKG